MPPQPPLARSRWFLLAVALAQAGGVIGYLPLLSLLLPIKIGSLAGPIRGELLAVSAIVGAVTAGVAAIGFGWLSDRSVERGGGRRGWIVGGLIATAASYGAVARAGSPVAVIGAVVAFQLSVNAVLAPLGAAIAEEVPDSQKGMVGGLVSLSAPIASVVTALLVTAIADETLRLLAVPLAAGAFLLPLIATPARHAAVSVLSPARRARRRRDISIAWMARLLVQVALSMVSLYLFYYLQAVAPMPPRTLAVRTAQLLTVAALVPVPLALILGGLSDRYRRRPFFLLAAAILAATGLLVMAGATGWGTAAAGYGCFVTGAATFSALNTGLSLQLLPDPRRRGRDLGLFNLANTLPALIGATLAWWFATPGAFAGALVLLAVLTIAGGLLTLAIREDGIDPATASRR